LGLEKIFRLRKRGRHRKRRRERKEEKKKKREAQLEELEIVYYTTSAEKVKSDL